MFSRESNASPRGSPFVDHTIELVIRGLATILICYYARATRVNSGDELAGGAVAGVHRRAAGKARLDVEGRRCALGSSSVASLKLL